MIQFKNGGEPAFKAIFDLFNKRLLYLATTIVHDEAMAADIVQDAFVKLWNRRESFNDMMAVKAFLYLCVKNSCRNEYKHNKVVEKYLSRQEEPIESPIMMAKIIEAEVLNNLYNAIEKLPVACREVVLLSYFEGMSNQEVAKQLNISINTVKTQKLRALRNLRMFLKDLSPGLVILVTEILQKLRHPI
ncbi:RNA polymerase sigma-70 factor [Parapedobacter koreensis]|nr:RNA polymerase sigma-70 factor [Parapedobacter koreensis]